MPLEKIPIILNYNGEPLQSEIVPDIAIIRHLHSAYNDARFSQNPLEINRYFGKVEEDHKINLSEKGLKQGLLLREMWKEINTGNKYVDTITSPFKRTMLTAEYISDKITTDEYLIERFAGNFYGMTRQQKIDKYPDFINDLKDKWSFAIEGCESYKSVSDRLILAIRNLRKNSAIVSHGEAITSFRCLFEASLGVGVNQFVEEMNGSFATNGSIIEYNFRNPNNILMRLSEINTDNSGYNIGAWQSIKKK
jgi:broad specificity phosphatase PhoE